MKIPSYNISPRVQCGKTAGKTRVSVTQLNPNQLWRELERMVQSVEKTTVQCGETVP